MKYLIVGSDCFMRGKMDKFQYSFERIPGPIDNCKLYSPMGIDYILSGEYLEDIKNKNFQIGEIENELQQYAFIFKDKIRVAHNDVNSEKFLYESIKRINNFKNNIFNMDVALCMNLNYHISKKVQEFQELFEKYPTLQRINFFLPFYENIENFDFFNSYNLIMPSNNVEALTKIKKI